MTSLQASEARNDRGTNTRDALGFDHVETIDSSLLLGGQNRPSQSYYLKKGSLGACSHERPVDADD